MSWHASSGLDFVWSSASEGIAGVRGIIEADLQSDSSWELGGWGSRDEVDMSMAKPSFLIVVVSVGVAGGEEGP